MKFSDFADRECTVGELALLLEVDVSDILDWQAKGMPYDKGSRPGKADQYNPAVCLRWRTGDMYCVEHSPLLSHSLGPLEKLALGSCIIGSHTGKRDGTELRLYDELAHKLGFSETARTAAYFYVYGMSVVVAHAMPLLERRFSS